MKKIILLVAAGFISLKGYCCVSCNKEVHDGIFNPDFYANIFQIFSAFIVIGIVVLVLAKVATRQYNARLSVRPEAQELASVPLMAAATVSGIGLGGFIDGIALHQVLQWHEMVSNRLPPVNFVNKSINMFWDGIFHSFTLVTTLIGIYLLWKLLQKANINRSGYLLAGGLAMGWGIFNLVEGIINHHILKLHNVHERSPNPDAWNYAFLVSGVALVLLGWLWMKKGEKEAFIA